MSLSAFGCTDGVACVGSACRCSAGPFFSVSPEKNGEKRGAGVRNSASRLNSLTFSLSALIGKQNQPIETAEEIRPELIHFTPHGALPQNVHAMPAEYLSGRNVILHRRRRTCDCTYFENVRFFRSTLHGTSFMRDEQCSTCRSTVSRLPYVKYSLHFDIPNQTDSMRRPKGVPCRTHQR